MWSFYLTFLNSVVELGPEEGKHAFGSTKWKALVAKARDGTVWEDVVRDGYSGIAMLDKGTVHFEVDSVHLSKLPPRLLQVMRALCEAASACGCACMCMCERSPTS